MVTVIDWNGKIIEDATVDEILKYDSSPIQRNLVEMLRKTGPITRRDLVKQLDIPRTTVYDNLLKLQKKFVVEKFTRNDGKRGRPLVLWKLNE